MSGGEPPVSESARWSSPGTGGPASACAARTRSSSRDPYPVGRRADRSRASPATSSPISHPDDTPAAARAKGKHSRDGGRRLPDEPRRRVRARRAGRVRGQATSWSPASGPTATTHRGAERGRQTSPSSIELDGVHAIHLGDIGHLLTEEKLGDIGAVDVVCVPIGGALSADPGRRRWSPSWTRASWCRCRSATTRPPRRGRCATSSTRWAPSRPGRSRSCRRRHRACPAETTIVAARGARQAASAVSRPARRQPRRGRPARA